MTNHHIQIGDIAPRTQITITSGNLAGPWTYPFPIFTDADIEVYYDGTLKTPTTHYTVAGAGIDEGGTVTPVGGQEPTVGVVVTLTRRLVIKRLTDFQDTGDFRTKVINDELDKIVAMLQQVWDAINARAVRQLESDSDATLTLPIAADRQGKLLGFDASGNAVAYTPNTDTYISLSAFMETLLDDPDAATARATLGAVIGADVQAYDAGISTTPLTEGTHTVFIPAGAMRPTVSNGCAAITDVETTAGRPDMQVLDFDASADEHAQFQIAFPKSWDEGTITFQVFWTSTATDTDGVAWGLQGVSVSDGDTIDVAYGTAVVVTDLNQSTAEDLYVTSVSGAVTLAGTPAAADMSYFRIFRDVSDAADTAAEDARLIGVKLFYTVDAGDDS